MIEYEVYTMRLTCSTTRIKHTEYPTVVDPNHTEVFIVGDEYIYFIRQHYSDSRSKMLKASHTYGISIRSI